MDFTNDFFSQPGAPVDIDHQFDDLDYAQVSASVLESSANFALEPPTTIEVDQILRDMLAECGGGPNIFGPSQVDDQAPPPPAAVEDVGTEKKQTTRYVESLREKRISNHILRIRKGGKPAEGGLRTGFDARAKKLRASMKMAHKDNSGGSQARGSRISTKGSKQATTSIAIRNAGELAADFEFLNASLLVVAAGAAGGPRAPHVYSLGSGKFSRILDMTLEDAIKLTSRPGTKRKNATSKLSIRALLEALEAAVDYPEVDGQMQMVAQDTSSDEVDESSSESLSS